ncbi:clarin-2 [Nothobranchius furzeri]|uniref:Clarin 2 n=2 Tax=Nothobranchius furzeri TaxID=105023 RepID=A0A8C6PC24_NOTFU|nr:clarin-2 [Nothobranchius furzeri]KAF7198985.1 clarin 2 [Nothobranchius furzeri]
MPSLWKRITFSVASVLCVGSVGLLVVALSTERWVTGRILCQTGVDLVNASHPELNQFVGDIYYGLFQGGKTKKCGLGTRRSKIYIFPNLVQTLNSGLHMMVILFLLVAVGFALVSLSFSIYNARKVPYQSIKGHKGLYLWNFIAALFGALGVLCFLAALRHHRLTERVANYKENLFVLVVLDDSLDWSFWLGVGSVGTHFAVCGVVAMSRFKLPKPEIKKPEQPTISSVDLLY